MIHPFYDWRFRDGLERYSILILFYIRLGHKKFNSVFFTGIERGFLTRGENPIRLFKSIFFFTMAMAHRLPTGIWH